RWHDALWCGPDDLDSVGAKEGLRLLGDEGAHELTGECMADEDASAIGGLRYPSPACPDVARLALEELGRGRPGVGDAGSTLFDHTAPSCGSSTTSATTAKGPDAAAVDVAAI